jgi:ABC-type nitrate/sulfonate/bicarbonate transport system substrate-binding protein
MKKGLFLLTVLLLVVGGVSACGGGAKQRPSQGLGANASTAPAEAGGGGGGETIKVALPTAKTSFANSDVFIAQKEGFFKQHGLNVEVSNFGSGLKSVQAALAGGVNIAGASIEPVTAAISQGQDLKIIGSYADRLTVDLVTPDAIANPQQLKGKPVGIQDVGAFREIMVRYVLFRNGMTPHDVQYRPVASNGYIQALIGNQIDGAVLQQEQYYDVQQKDPGKYRLLVDLYKLQPNYFYGAYFAKGSWLKDHPKEAEGFAAALIQAHRFMYKNRAATIRDASEATGFPPDVIAKAYDVALRQNDVFPVDDGLDPGRLNYTFQQLEKLKVISGKAPSYSQAVDAGPGQTAIKAMGPAQRGAGA